MCQLADQMILLFFFELLAVRLYASAVMLYAGMTAGPPP